MGREADRRKPRVCQVCHLVFNTYADDLIEHSLVCARLERAGLVHPNKALLVQPPMRTAS